MGVTTLDSQRYLGSDLEPSATQQVLTAQQSCTHESIPYITLLVFFSVHPQNYPHPPDAAYRGKYTKSAKLFFLPLVMISSLFSTDIDVDAAKCRMLCSYRGGMPRKKRSKMSVNAAMISTVELPKSASVCPFQSRDTASTSRTVTSP